MHHRMRPQNPSSEFISALIVLRQLLECGESSHRFYFRIATGLDKVSGFELFVTVWFARAALPDGLRRYRDKTIRRVRADW